MQWSRHLVIVYVNIALYAFCFQMQRPIEPFLVKSLGSADSDVALEYGNVQSFFGIMQTFGSFFFGLLLDRIGAKAGFMVVFLSASMSYSLLSMATSMKMLYLSKVPTMFLHSFLVAQMFITQETAPRDRARALGYLMGSYTIGATIGPALGGFLGAAGDHSLGAQIAAAGSLVSAGLTLSFPSHASPATKADRVGVLAGVRQVSTNAAVICVLATKLASTTVSSVVSSVQPVIFMQEFGMKEAGMGVFMSAGMFCNAICGWFVVGTLKDKFDRGPLVFGCILWMSFCYGLQFAFVPGGKLLEAVLAVLPVHPAGPWVVIGILGSMAAFMRGTCLTDISTSSVPNDLKGTLLGMEHGIFSFAGTVTPRVGTSLLTTVGISGLVALGSAVEFANAFTWRFFTHPQIERTIEAKASEEPRPDEKKTL